MDDSVPADRPLLGRARGEALHVMSLNVRCDVAATDPDDPDHWAGRAPAVARLLRAERPALLGVQEALLHQLPVLDDALGGDRRRVGFGREGGGRGEHCALFYDSTRLELLDWDQRWLSDTPDVVGSATWGNQVTRVVVWARLRDLVGGDELLAVNSHFDHESEDARVRAAATVRDLVARTGLPAVLTVDANAPAGRSAAYDLLVGGGLVDTWTAARERVGEEVGTFPDYGPPQRGGDRIDWILTTPDLVVERAAIDPGDPGGPAPSDHLAVHASIRPRSGGALASGQD